MFIKKGSPKKSCYVQLYFELSGLYPLVLNVIRMLRVITAVKSIYENFVIIYLEIF